MPRLTMISEMRALRRPAVTGGFRVLQLTGMLLGLLCLTGCATGFREYVQNGFKVGPNYCRPATAVAEQWIDANNPNVNTGPAETADWWRTFNDPVLDRLIQTAYQQNLSLRVAGFRVLEARAQRAIAVGGLFPQAQAADGSYTRINLSKNGPSGASPNLYYGDWNLGAALAWELDFWGRFRRAVEAADANLDASVENYDDVLVILLAEVGQRYVDLRTAQESLRYAKKNVKTQRDSLSLAEVKFQNGATTRLDVTQGQSNVAQTEAAIPPLEVNYRQAANQLSILLGMPPGNVEALLDGEKDIPAAPAQVAVGVPAELLRRRPDVRRAERQVAAQCAQIGIAESELYPHLSISGSIYLDSTRFADLFDAHSLAGAVGPSFNWNILNYGRLVNGVRVQDARFEQLAVQYQDTVLRANAEAENALVGFLQSQQRVKALTRSTEAAEQSLNLVRDQYEAGKTDFNRVLTVEKDLFQQQIQLASARGLVMQYLVQLYKALGGGWEIRLNETAMTQE
jgi:NodT family efflux transporter outer membrane factor (OMF) lipoprotein